MRKRGRRSPGRSRYTLRVAVLVAVFAGGGAASIAAQEREDLSRLSCADAAELVSKRGTAVVSTGPVGYERVVRDAGFCALDETTSPAYAATGDRPACFVGYRCRAMERGERQD